MQENELKEIFSRYKAGIATDEEKALLESWYLKFNDYENSQYPLEDRLEDADSVWSELNSNEPKIFRIWPYISAAAVILMVISFGIYFYTESASIPTLQYVKKQNDIAPGSNKAVLTLADGRKISLTDATSGELAEQSGINITKAADGQLLYTISDASSASGKLEFNTIETPKGGQYQIVLPDGTKVWLNAASSLKFPVSFTSLKERQVELVGEAYFEVAKEKAHPFIVSTEKQKIQVLGTHFNVYAYKEESAVKTTLLEGSVEVFGTSSKSDLHNKVKLSPGEQSISTNNGIEILRVDTEEAVAWKQGYFRFDDESLENIMRKISRWYNVDVYWEDDGTKKETYAAVTTRFDNVSRLLKMLEQTGDAQFEIEERIIKISKKKK